MTTLGVRALVPAEGHRELETKGQYGAFEQTLERVFGAQVRCDEWQATELAKALPFLEWCGPDGECVQYSRVQAAVLMASLTKAEGERAHQKFLVSGLGERVPEWIARALRDEGWVAAPPEF
jgi:hypothetical protein